MSEKALLVEIEKEKQKQVEKKLDELKKERKEVKKSRRTTTTNVFSSSAFSQNNDEVIAKIKKKEEPKASETVIETPNYDMMESLTQEQRSKVFVEEKVEAMPKQKPKNRKFAMIVLSIMFGIFGVWGLVNISQIDSLNHQIAEISTQYELNLIKYTTKLKSLDMASAEKMETLIETIPDEVQMPTTIEKTSNWFDRFCNFFSKIFK